MANTLSPADQQLLAKTFPPEMEKAAAAKVAAARECYSYGHDKIAAEIIAAQDEADAQAKVAAEEKKDEHLDEEGEKKAAEYGAIIEQGVYDRLVKEGTAKHQDPHYYLFPYAEQKIAEMGAAHALQKAAALLGK